MAKNKKKKRKFFRYFFRAMKYTFIVFFIFLGSLFFREQTIPHAWVNAFLDRHVPTNLVVQCSRVSFGFQRGLHLSGLRVYMREKIDALEPVVAIRETSLDFWHREIRLDELKIPCLHDGYYLPGGFQERAARLEINLPQISEFRLELVRPSILGLTPDRVVASVSCEPTCVFLDHIHIDWPNKTHDMNLDGKFKIDLATQRAHGDVRGLSTVAQIRPLLVALDVPSALPYMDAFTELPEPVNAYGSFDVNLFNNDFRMLLDLHPKLGRYNGVPLKSADGILKLYVFTRGTNCNVNLDVDLARAIDLDGQTIGGHIAMNMSNDLVRLKYDVKSELAFRDALEIADFMNPDTLDVLVCDTKPTITLKGTSGISIEDVGHNHLDFSAALAKGSFMGLQVRDLKTNFAIHRETIEFSRLEAKGRAGGKYTGTAKIEIPGYEQNRANFSVNLTCKDGSLEELADVADFDLGEHKGTVNGWCELSGPLATNYLSDVDGKGCIKITEGHLAQMKLFAGLTKSLAEKVPGVSFLVNQTDASADFTLTDGVLHSDNIFIEGGFISIKAWGSYDIVRDHLDLTVRVQLLKNESLLATLVHPITLPFSKLLLEFKATGPVDNPEWTYVNLLDRIL